MRPKIVIDNLVYQKVMHWVNKSSYEVSGLGKVEVLPGGVLHVTDVMLLPQKNGSTHTDIEPEDVNRALYRLRDSVGDLRWWWHSHVDMGVFWSGTDMDTIKKIGAGGWFACSVFNKKREVRSAYFGQTGQVLPWGTTPLFLDQLDTEVEEFINPAVADWDAEYDANVKIERLAVSSMFRSENSQLTKYERNPETGIWNPVSGETSGGTGVKIVTYDATQEPPETRPPFMPKRVYKAWKRDWRERQQKLALPDLTPVEDALPPVDDYGFDQDEKQILILSEWTDDEVQEFVETHDAAPTEIFELAEAGITPTEVRYTMATQNCSVAEVLRLAFDTYPTARNYQ